MADRPQMPTQFRPAPPWGNSIARIVLIVVLAVLTGLLVVLAEGPSAFTFNRWLRSPVQATLPADILYRFSAGLAASGYEAHIEAVSAHRLEQAAIALYEQNALGPQPSAEASCRLAIIYAKSGYQEHAGEMFRRAMQRDTEHTKLYLLLMRLYTDQSVEEDSLLERVALLDDQDQWLAALTRADLYERVGHTHQAAELRADWQRRQVLFCQIVGALMAFYAAMGVGGIAILAMVVITWLAGRTQRKSLWRVPWSLVDVAEAIVVLLLLLVCISMITAAFRGIIGSWLPSETFNAILMAAGYLFAGACTIALIIYRIGPRRDAWRLLGLRLHNLAAQIGQGIAGYATIVGLLIIALTILGQSGIEQIVPMALKTPLEVFLAARNPATFVVYFVLVGILAPIVEEIIFRGFVYPALRRIMAVPPAALASALIFAAVHISASLGGVLMITLVGVVLAYLYERNRSLIPSMITHAMYNSFVLLLLASYVLV